MSGQRIIKSQRETNKRKQLRSKKFIRQRAICLRHGIITDSYKWSQSLFGYMQDEPDEDRVFAYLHSHLVRKVLALEWTTMTMRSFGLL